ncbi:uncharacterized protein IWZ02DRAFT_271836 [Phyllosticta citriasiana]|uniref:uncharacterized protein n=1 Tax=Phyllosticta citriasiana TaxID=595635 RepID=UPI0030FD9A5A
MGVDGGGEEGGRWRDGRRAGCSGSEWVEGVEGSLVDTSGVADYSGSDANRYSTSRYWVNNSRKESPRTVRERSLYFYPAQPSPAQSSPAQSIHWPRRPEQRRISHRQPALCHFNSPKLRAHGPHAPVCLRRFRSICCSLSACGHNANTPATFGGLGLSQARVSVQPNKVESVSLPDGICNHSYTAGPDLRLSAAEQSRRRCWTTRYVATCRVALLGISATTAPVGAHHEATVSATTRSRAIPWRPSAIKKHLQ